MYFARLERKLGDACISDAFFAIAEVAAVEIVFAIDQIVVRKRRNDCTGGQGLLDQALRVLA